MKKYLAIAAGLLILAGCAKEPQGQENIVPGGTSFTPTAIRIAPVMTKVTQTAFENGDAIGLTVSRATADYATNKKLTYNGLEFTSDLLWYAEGGEPSNLLAYYPYNPDGVPHSFSVAADQSAGVAPSDFVAAIREDVLPTANAITMPFKHKLSRILVAVTNNAGYSLDAIKLKGIIPTATIDVDFSATADLDEAPVDITACEVEDNIFTAIVPPQTVAITAEIIASGVPMQQRLAEATLAAGKVYTINVIVNPENIQVLLSGTIEDWTDGGTIQEDNTPIPIQFEEHLDEGYFTYDNVRYNVVKMGDNKWWMVQNLAFLPEGVQACTSLSNVTAGVYAPIDFNEGTLQFSTSADLIAANGYLYQGETALGVPVGSITTVEAAQALEGAQGICPDGWHIPTKTDITNLVGKGVGITTNADAPYYNGSNGSIAMLNADGFNLAACGAITISDFTKTSGTFMGKLSSYTHLASGYIVGSTYATVTYNTSGDATSGVKNLMFCAMMPMTNKDTEAEYTCNGSNLAIRTAASVRCVRN